MRVLKEAGVDIVVTIMIVLAVVFEVTWGRWALVVYVVLMLVLKTVALFSSGVRNLTTQQRRGSTPTALFHALYGINTLVVALAGWWELVAGWAAIWIVSVLIERQR